MEYKIGDIVDGIITGIKPYGAFVSINKDNIGLIHISEISSGFVRDVASFLKVNEKVQVKIIDVDMDNNQYKLSFKAIDGTGRRNKNKLPRIEKIENQVLGFKTLKDNLQKWIDDALKEN